MHNHPVNLHWKGGAIRSLLAEIRPFLTKEWKDTTAEEILESCKPIIEGYVCRGQIFASLPGRGKGFTAMTGVVIDFKAFKIAEDADDRQPLTLLRPNGGIQPVYYCRPSRALAGGLVFKLIPLGGVQLVRQTQQLHDTVTAYINANYPAPEELGRDRKFHPLNTNGPQQLATA